MKNIFVPHLNRHIVLGACKLPSPHRPRIKLSSYIDAATIPDSPDPCDYSQAALSVIQNVEGNDSVGDCVLAEEAHFIGVVTGNAGTLYSYTAAQTLAAYSAITGYNPADPSTDQGTDPITCLNYFCKTPYADGTALAGYAEVDMTNQKEVEFAISAFGNLKLWAALPDKWVNPFPSSNGFVWDVASPNPEQGHCFGSGSYNSPLIVGAPNAKGVQIYTWGLIGTLTWAGATSLCAGASGGGAAVRITPDWLIKSSGKTPSGFAYADLISDFNKIFGGSVPVPTPAPAPLPPGTVVTPDMVKAWIDAGFAASPHGIFTRATAAQVADAVLAAKWPAS